MVSGGGNSQLFENLHLSENDWVWDVGGYHGEWTKQMLIRYGCRSELFEPAPNSIAVCRETFGCNSRVRLHAVGLGDEDRTARFNLLETGTSEFLDANEATTFNAEVVSVVDEIRKRIRDEVIEDRPGVLGCMKINIEGGEYAVLEKLIETREIRKFRCLLIQFHRQPPGYESRYTEITRRLSQTHRSVFAYPFVWERWVLSI